MYSRFLLNNEQLLNDLKLIDISANDYVLLLGDTNEHKLSENDMRKSIDNYSTNLNEIIRFRIHISIQIRKYAKDSTSNLLISNPNQTIEQIFQSIENKSPYDKYLASSYTKMILNFNENLLNLIGTSFILVKESETCLVSIQHSQRFTIYATITDIYRQNQFSIDQQFLLFSDDFVPNFDTQLISLLHSSSRTIQLTLMETNLPLAVTVEHKQQSVKFNCSSTITVTRLCSIACQLLHLNNQFYKLEQDGCLLDDDDVTLNDIDSTESLFRFQLHSTASIFSLVQYENQTIELPCELQTSAKIIVEDALKLLKIPIDDIDFYELFALAEDSTNNELEMTIEDIDELFSPSTTIIPFQLIQKK